LPILVDPDGALRIFGSNRRLNYFYNDEFGVHKEA